MTNYFAQCQTTNEARNLYRQLCHAHHPDLHPENANATQEMQDINAQYDAFCQATRPEEMRQRAKQHQWRDPTESDFGEAFAQDVRVREAIERIIRLEGISIEVCGVWVWVSGDTKPVKDQLKQAHYQWSPKKAMWYFAGKPASPWAKGDWTIDDIRNEYGSTRIKQPDRKDQDQARAPQLQLRSA